MDEISRQLLAAERPPPLVRAAKPEGIDYEYLCDGVANVFLFCERFQAKRWANVTDRPTKLNWAYGIKNLVDVRNPEAVRIILIVGNLNIHTPPSLYEVFAPAEAKRLAGKLEIQYNT